MKEVKLRIYLDEKGNTMLDCENCSNKIVKLALEQFEKINKNKTY